MLGCSCGNSCLQFPNASVLGMRNLLHLCNFTYYFNSDFLRFSLPYFQSPVSNLWFPLACISPQWVSCWVKYTSSSSFPFPPFSHCWQLSNIATLTLSPVPSISSSSANTVGELCPFSLSSILQRLAMHPAGCVVTSSLSDSPQLSPLSSGLYVCLSAGS